MRKDSYYTLEFQFDKSSEGLDHLFPSIELLIRSLENIDRYLVSAVGYDLSYKRYLKNIGEDSFTFSIRVRLFQPEQIALGQNFPFDDVRLWMEKGRQLFVERANNDMNLSDEEALTKALEGLVHSYNLDNTILYSCPGGTELQALSDDLNNAVSFLGGKALINQR